MHLRNWAPILCQWKWLISKGGDKCGWWHKCAFTRGVLIAVKVSSQKQGSKCHPQAWHKGLSLSVNVRHQELRRRDPRRCLPVYVHISESTLSWRDVPSVYKWLFPSKPLGGEPARIRKPLPSSCNTQLGAAACWYGLHWSVYLHEKNPNFSICHMPYKKGGPLAQE